jgi:hypothetical protein
LTVKWLLDRPGHDYRRGESEVMSGATRAAHEGGFDLRPLQAIRGWIAREEAGVGIA